VTGDATYDLVLAAGLVLAGVTAVATRFVTTPYGRFERQALGPTVPQRVGWLLMELPSPMVFFAVYATGAHAREPVPLLFAAIWAVHYANRALAFPLLMKIRKGARMGLEVPLSGWIVVPMHAWLYARWVSDLGARTPAWLADPRFLVGLPTYLLGLGLILHSERVLRSLRSDREVEEGGSYKVPFGGGFRLVSSPHYLGEILAWTGLMLATGCPGGLFVLAITLANLVPRAAATHRWYRERFPEYPAERRALVPFLW
jgi:3-oxo-5-alpha-steroid 4-dehydrogenase 1